MNPKDTLELVKFRLVLGTEIAELRRVRLYDSY